MTPSAEVSSSSKAVRRRQRFAVKARSTTVIAALFLISASFVLAKTGRDALYFSGGGLADLPLTYVGMAAMAPVVGLATLTLMRRMGAQRARLVAVATWAVALAGLAGALRPGGGLWASFAFMAIPLVFGVLFSMTWLLVGEVTISSPEVQPRDYSIAAAGSLIGGIAGGLVAKALGPAVSPRVLLLIAGATLGGAGLALRTQGSTARRTRPARPAPARADPRPDRVGPQVSLLVKFSMLAGVVGVLIEYHFYAAAGSTAASAAATGRFANLYLGLNTAALVGLFVTPVLQRTTGLGGTLMALPAAVSMVVSAIWVGGAASGRGVLRLAEGGLKASTHRVGWEQLFARVAPERRSTVKLMVEGTAARVAEGVTGAGLYLAALIGSDLSGATTVLVAVSSVWVVVTAWLWKTALQGTPGDPACGPLARLPDS